MIFGIYNEAMREHHPAILDFEPERGLTFQRGVIFNEQSHGATLITAARGVSFERKAALPAK
jgi:hypothetical protein